jgi:hypothetical protein
MRFDADIQLDTRRLNEIIRNIDGNVYDAIRAIAFAIEAKAKVRAPVDTGALRSSIYVRVGNKTNNFGEASADARQRRPEAPIVELPAPESNAVAHIGPAVGYGAEVELGSHTRAGRPYLAPAVREVEGDLERYLRQVVTNER